MDIAEKSDRYRQRSHSGPKLIVTTTPCYIIITQCLHSNTEVTAEPHTQIINRTTNQPLHQQFRISPATDNTSFTNNHNKDHNQTKLTVSITHTTNKLANPFSTPTILH